MKKYISFQEAKQVGIIYHFTNYDIKGILRTDSMGAGIRPGAHLNGEEFYTVSFTRDYALKHFEGNNLLWGPCRIALDGNKLSENYKMMPYNDFWKFVDQERFKQITNYKPQKHTNFNQSEVVAVFKTRDRFSAIKNIHKYIIQIDILDDYRSMYEDELKEINKFNIKINFVDKFRPIK